MAAMVLRSVFVSAILTACNPAMAGITLTFDGAVPGTLHDANGLGTGFTHRMPGTGTAFPANDPHMDLLGSPGNLLLGSEHGSIGGASGGTDLANTVAPGVFLAGIGSQDFVMSALFQNVQVQEQSDQLFLYVGLSSTQHVRAGFHHGNQFSIAANYNGSGDFGYGGPIGAFATGDDIVLALTRTAGVFELSWNNLTNPAASGSSGTMINVGPAGPLSFPWLNSEPDLYFGIVHSDAGNFTPQTATVDYFSVAVVPEPTSLITWSVVGLAFAAMAIYRRTSN